MKRFKVKFFGAKAERHEQLKQVKTIVEAPSKEDVRDVLSQKYSVINGLKIREIEDVVEE